MRPLRIAAIADLHVRSRDDLSRIDLSNLDDVADVLLLAGDLTENGLVAEMQVLADVLTHAPVPAFAIFGNHDRRGMRRRALSHVLRDAGVRVLDGTSALLTLPDGHTIGIVGVIGTGGGFRPGEQFGPGARFTKAAMVKSRRESARLRKALKELREHEPNQTIVMTHFSPTTSTLGAEPPLKYWMLGNALLGRTIDEFSPDLVIHGHSHLGNERGSTDAGSIVWNVALPVIGGIPVLHLHRDGTTDRTALLPLDLAPGGTSVRESDVA